MKLHKLALVLGLCTIMSVPAFATNVGIGNTTNNTDNSIHANGGNGGAGGSAVNTNNITLKGGNTDVDNTNTNRNNNTNTSDSNSSVRNSGNSASNSSVRNSGNSASNSRSNANNAGQNVAVNEDYKAAASGASAPALASGGNDTCMGSTSAGAQALTFGASFGSTWTDQDCVRRKNATFMSNVGEKTVAMGIMCESDTVYDSIMAVGTADQKAVCGRVRASKVSSSKTSGNFGTLNK